MPDKTQPLDDAATGTNGAAWLSSAAAALALGVSEKTVWRRARAGKLTARKVKGARGVLVWEVCLNHTGQSNRPTGQTIPATNADIPAKVPEIEHKVTGQPMRPITGQKKKTKRARLNDLRDDVKFLRGVIEQLQRDSAELRAAHRAALKLIGDTSAPQLTAGTPETPERTQNATAGNVSNATPDGAKSPANARQSDVYDYNAIADKIERGLNNE